MNTFLFLFYLIIFYLIVDFIYKNIKLLRFGPKGTPGIALPIIGHLHLLAGKTPNIIKLHEWTKTLGHVYKLYLGDSFVIVIADPVIMSEIYVKNFETFKNRIPSLLSSYVSNGYKNILAGRDEHWKLNRQIISKSFTTQKIKTLHTIMEKECGELIDILKLQEKSGEVIYPEALLRLFPLNIILQYVFSEKITYGETIKNQRILGMLKSFAARQKIMSVVFERYISVISLPMYIGRRLFQTIPTLQMAPFVEEILKNHLETVDKENPRDLLDDLIIGNFEHNDIVEKILFLTSDLIIAGSDTTGSTMTWFCIYMVNYPEVQEKIYNELKSVGALTKSHDTSILSFRPSTPYLRAVIKEVMRIRPVIPTSGNRECNQDITIQGILIPKGTMILPLQYSIFHSEDYFKNPEEFNPNRFLEEPNIQAFSPVFGMGTRDCVGKNLANDELYLLAANLLKNFKFESVDGKPISDHKNFKFTLFPDKYSVKITSRT